ncbi:cell separation during budding [Coemansia sp. RSA 1813]|nr:cell separation during budding [Coemansia sp. RSA 1646]KAJ1766645.1 cell separation during budding [Coemansia sp. RSA 1843]KAJ2085674.1 cell separation during budding [Coemansia sp. RSA 986]KAJ2212321.1 cell separation during budding [Coemansia sp. RSA 487]KAJ2563015.1 cell separation during budding [Coemansia sp. RSA 1813]
MDRPGLGASAHWLSVQAQDLVESQNVVQIDSETTIDDACDTLIKHNVQSVPLYDSSSQSYVGMFDLHDLATYILMKRHYYPHRDKTDESSPQPLNRGNSSPLAKRATLARRDSQGGSGGRLDQVSKVTDLSHMNPFYSVVPETTVAQVGAVFAKGAHRVAVMQSERTIRGILSQARVVKYFFEHTTGSTQDVVQQTIPEDATSRVRVAPEESAILDKSLRELGLVTNDVVVAHPTTPVIQALSLLERWHISSIAIVEEDISGRAKKAKQLVGNLSVTDIKYLARDKSLVDGTCIELIQKVRFLQGVQDGQDRAAVFSVRPEATLRYALSKLIATGAHRVWITEPPLQDQHQCRETPLSQHHQDSNRALSEASSTTRGRRASVSSASSQTVAIAPSYYAGAFGDTVCGVMSLTDVLRLLMENAPNKPPAKTAEYNYASMD